MSFLHALKIECQKLCSNRATRPSESDKHDEWRSYIGTWESATKIWEDICWRVSFPNEDGKSFAQLGCYSNLNGQGIESVLSKIYGNLKPICKEEFLTLTDDGVKVKIPIDATQNDENLKISFNNTLNLFKTLLPVYIKFMHNKIADINALFTVEENLDYVANWDENTETVLIVAGNWGHNIAKKYGVYECQNFRTFRSAKFLAFYDNGRIEELFEIVGKPYDNATSTNTPEILKISLDMPQYNGNELRRCFKLKSLGNVGPIENDTLSRNGKKIPFTYGQARYTTVDLVRKAKKTSELIHGLEGSYITNTYINNKTQESPKVDILWVIDNSGSMSSYQNSLANSFDAFIADFINKPVKEIPDFKMAITSTDEGGNGKIDDGDGFICKDYAVDEDLMEMVPACFMIAVKVGTSGSATEKGLKCAWLALKNNASFFRKDAPLVINIVTDEEDDDNVPVEDYLNNMNAEKNGQRIIINLIGLPGFNRYNTAVRKTNGVYLDIKSDFKNVMKHISLQLNEVAQSFPLTHQPLKPAEIQVLSEGSKTTDFVYSNSSNAIKLGETIPVSALIEVEYEIED